MLFLVIFAAKKKKCNHIVKRRKKKCPPSPITVAFATHSGRMLRSIVVRREQSDQGVRVFAFSAGRTWFDMSARDCAVPKRLGVGRLEDVRLCRRAAHNRQPHFAKCPGALPIRGRAAGRDEGASGRSFGNPQAPQTHGFRPTRTLKTASHVGLFFFFFFFAFFISLEFFVVVAAWCTVRHRTSRPTTLSNVGARL